ncbi:ATP-binding protein [Actinoallomurus iriomotensis]|uniref:LuxR family transcriptional regulator n=1 Tax=Actinoallomurus iriomotensis TaxID=478107 RepID=A0A9W6RRY9_9ACTN|nr:LuxR C-terminal-related transcriptional regulator [Actinoallomurus iriomotensis]GLY80638.1 LuxR family transcriptional regulator [Actinoallomurus iriomotensis]
MTERTADGWRDGYVPAELNGFVGRRELLSSAKARLSDPRVRLLSLTGAGGTGKTRLAMRLANDARRAHPDGVWWVDLASHTDPASVGRVMLDALPVDDVSAREPGDVLVAALSRRAALLVLDNCEHLIGTLAPLVVRLLRGCPDLRIIATSRVPLRCEGEHLVDVPPLSVPADPDRAVVTEYEAVRLFETRASAARADFAITPRSAADVARLVRMLDGIPLAIELAAPLVRVMSVAEIVSMLSVFRLRTLSEGVNAPTRHRTLWDSFEWSYQLCSPAERLLWVRLAVFAGGFTMDAAVAVAAGGELEAGQVPMVLGELAAKSIIVADTDSIPTRYAMLATVREYGLTRLGSRTGDLPEPESRPAPPSDDEIEAHRRLSAHFLDRAEWCSRHWYGPDEARYLSEARQDLPNHRAVLDRCAAATTREDAEVGARLAVALTEMRLWFFGGTLGEGMRALTRAEEALAANAAAAPLRLTALSHAGWIALCLGDEISTESLLRRCRALASEVSGADEAAFALAVHRYFIASTALILHGDSTALPLWAGVRDELAAMNDTRVLPMAEMFHAIAAAFTAPAPDAFAVTERHLADARAHGAPCATAWAEWARALAELRHGDAGSAVALFRSALRSQWDIGERWGAVWSMESLAWCAMARGHHEEAALLLGAARNMQETLGVAIHRLRPWAEAHSACAEQARLALGEAYDVTESYGAEMELGAAVDLALGQPSTPRSDAPARRRSVNRLLSDKQRAVAELIAEGKTDKQIASVLFLSPRTVQSHVSAILRKLGFTSRAEIAAWVVEQQSGAAPRS